MRNKILVVEEAAGRRDALLTALTEGNFFVIPALNAEKALERIWKGSPDLILMAAQLSGMTSVQFAAYLRGDPRLRHIPVMLVSEPMPSQNVVTYFKAGVDDHVLYTTPPDEVFARIRALIRRVFPGEGEGEDDRVYEFAGLVLRVAERLVSVQGRPVDLTRKEFDLLRALLGRPDKVMATAKLLSSVWGYDKDVSTKTLQVHINRLRQKLGPMASKIRNFPGIGYAFSTESREQQRTRQKENA